MALEQLLPAPAEDEVDQLPRTSGRRSASDDEQVTPQGVASCCHLLGGWSRPPTRAVADGETKSPLAVGPGRVHRAEGRHADVREARPEHPADPVEGPLLVSDVPALERYVQMLQSVRDRVAAMIAQGKSLEQVVASDPTAGFEQAYGDVAASLGFVDRVYTSLAKKQ